jgi:anti-sigma factor RsiW
MSADQPTPRPPCRDAADSVTCQRCVDFLLDYLDGLLPEGDRFRFESHIAFCKDCEVFLSNYRKALALSSELGRDRRTADTAEAPQALIDAILRARKHSH